MSKLEKDSIVKTLLEARALYNASNNKFNEAEAEIRARFPDDDHTDQLVCELFDKTFNTQGSSFKLSEILDRF